jgi:2-methylisocitrate lyase-like PEP mutase family enzyme
MSVGVIEYFGFGAVYLTGAGVTNMSFGLPDLGFVGLSDMAEHVARIRDTVDLPMLVDADTGFGNALNVRHAVRTLECAGADAIQLENQVMPKKCGHFSGKHVIPTAEMASKIRAVADSHEDEHFQNVALTDVAAVHGIDHAIERLPALFKAPVLINIVIGGKTPVQSRERLERLGYGLVLYANAALQGAVHGMQQALGQLQSEGQLDEDPAIVALFGERQRLVKKLMYDELDARYKDAH